MDLYRIFKPVIFISRVFCLAPFAAVEDSGSTRYKLSTFWLLYSILGVCATFIVKIHMLWFSLFFSGATILNVTSKIMAAATCVASVVTQVLCLNNGKNVLRILDHVSVLDSEHNGARISYYRLYNLFNLLLTYSIMSLLTPAIMYFATMNTNSVFSLKTSYSATVFLISDIVLLLSNTQFVNFFLLLKYRFSVLNDTLINFTVPSLYQTSLNHMIRAPAVDRSLNSSTSAVSSSIRLLQSTLRKVCRHHDALCDISEFVNRTYSLQILLSVTVTCIEVLLASYTVSIEFSYTSIMQHNSFKQYFSVATFVWLFAVSSKVVLIVVVCNRASYEVSGLHLWCLCVCFMNT